MTDGELTPEWAAWVEMAASQVIRHMDGHPMVPVSYAFAAQAHRRRVDAQVAQDANRARRLESAKKPAGPPSALEKQVLAGLDLEMTQGQIAQNLRVREIEIEDAVRMLRKRGLL